ncbi:MAG TPA: DUF1992 domain-containing protein [Kineosporiaceae bacterium]|nr:DUF1992 domain-containing protein [Kineosporiaceae bacterium]
MERRIREATERGEFDNLPGAGRPLDLSDADDPNWWIKRFVRRENVDLAAVLPGTLALRREADTFPESLADLTTDEQVRAVLMDFNARVEADWRRPARDSGFPLPARQVDVEALVVQWRQLPGRRGPQPVDATADPPVEAHPPGRWRRWPRWPRWRGWLIRRS